MFDREEATWGAEWQADRVTCGRHFLRDMEGLWQQILKLAATVETTLNNSVRALCDGRADLAEGVNFDEESIDRWEVQIERDCLKVLALHQPVASDLRRVTVIMRINGDLERMADLARHIAKRARKLSQEPIGRALPRDLEVMAAEALEQVRESLDALTQGNVDQARAVIAGDRKVDRHRGAVIKELKQAIRDDPDRLDSWLRLINATRNLERVADHATNIAEAVVYLKEGDIIRHVASTGRFAKPKR
jgi:phosphate transport system protein